MVQWLRPHASNAGDAGLIPGHETKIPHAVGRGQKVRKKNQGPIQAEYFLSFKKQNVFMYLAASGHS